LEGLGRNPEPFRYAPDMGTGLQLFINICGLLIGLVVLQVFLKMWDKNAKAKEAAAAEAKVAEAKKTTKPKKK
jgi:L-lactate permease